MEELKYVSREDANNAGIHVPRETIKPYASYPVREIIVRGVSNDNEYTVGVLRSFSGQLYLFDVSERISINQSKQIFDYVSQEFTEIYEFHIEYPDTCYDKLA
ncbi:MAG: hypothetical protein LBG97_05395, partial [Coriobacteriales bacterium]|nr:hypothetical protein [Coriobacteriales bacterium]